MSDDFIKFYKGLRLKPQATDPSNPEEGDLFRSDGTSRSVGVWEYKTSSWQQLGTGAGGGFDTYYTENFEDTLATDMTTGNNSSFLGAGASTADPTDEVTTPIEGLRSLTYTHIAGSLDDYAATPTHTLEPLQQGNESGFTAYTTYDGADDDMYLVLYGTTTGAVLEESPVKASTIPLRHIFSKLIPSTEAGVRVGYHVKVENIGSIFVLDVISLSTDPFTHINLDDLGEWTVYTPIFGSAFGTPTNVNWQYKDVGDTTFVKGTHNNGNPLGTGTMQIGIPPGHTINGTNLATIDILGFVSRDVNTFNTYSVLSDTATDDTVIYVGQYSSVTAPFTKKNHSSIVASELMHFEFSFPNNNNSTAVVSPAKSNLEKWTSFNPTLGIGFGTTSSEVFYWRQVGDEMEIRGLFTQGTVAASEASITLPNSKIIDTDKIATTQVSGRYAGVRSDGTGSILVNTGSSTTKVFFGPIGAATGNLTANNGSAIGANSALMSVHFKVPIVGWDSTSAFLAAIPVDEFQTKKLTADVTTDTTMSDLTFNNLVIGRTYDYKINAYFSKVIDASSQVSINHDGSIIEILNHDPSGSTTGNSITYSTSGTFTATTTTLTFVSIGLSANNIILGNDTLSETFAQIKETNTKETTRFT